MEYELSLIIFDVNSALSVPTDGKWHFVYFAIDSESVSKECRFGLDGSFETVAITTNIPLVSNIIYIGKDVVSSKDFKGDMRYVSLEKRALR